MTLQNLEILANQFGPLREYDYRLVWNLKRYVEAYSITLDPETEKICNTVPEMPKKTCTINKMPPN